MFNTNTRHSADEGSLRYVVQCELPSAQSVQWELQSALPVPKVHWFCNFSFPNCPWPSLTFEKTNFNFLASCVTENSLIKLSWYLVLWGEIGKKCCRREKMVHIFHNKETPLYKRFPDGWPTKAKWKTLPVSILPQPQLNIIMTTFVEVQAFLKKNLCHWLTLSDTDSWFFKTFHLAARSGLTRDPTW